MRLVKDMNFENLGYILLQHRLCYFGKVASHYEQGAGYQYLTPDEVCRLCELMIFSPRFTLAAEDVQPNGSFTMVVKDIDATLHYEEDDD